MDRTVICIRDYHRKYDGKLLFEKGQSYKYGYWKLFNTWYLSVDVSNEILIPGNSEHGDIFNWTPFTHDERLKYFVYDFEVKMLINSKIKNILK